MRFLVQCCVLAIAASLVSAPALAAGDALTGKMQPFTYLLGAAWNCSTNVPTMGNMAAHTEQGTATFEIVPGNVVHNRVLTQNYSGDFYFGYSDRFNSYWQTDADNMAGHAFLTSTDGKTYTGTASMGTMGSPDTVTYTKVGDNKVTIHEVVSGSGPQAVFDTTCTR